MSAQIHWRAGTQLDSYDDTKLAPVQDIMQTSTI